MCRASPLLSAHESVSSGVSSASSSVANVEVAGPMHVGAWCSRKLGIRPGRVRGIRTTNYGICSDCLAERLVALMGAPPQAPYRPLQSLDLTELGAASRLDEAV
jgi:hypothetical protein